MMFDLSLEKLFILAIVALFVLGPERLPTAAVWVARTLRQVRDFASEANHRLRSELGPEFDELRPALHDLRQDVAGLRIWRDPRTALLHHLSDDPVGFLRYPVASGAIEPPMNPWPVDSLPLRPFTHGQRPPFDPEAT
jgi:sec-independent protein translocase protein TatB